MAGPTTTTNPTTNPMTEQPAPRVLTVGHSTHPLETFLALLQAHGVTVVVDVRTVPKSRRHPWFESGALSASLRAAGVGYVHVAALGGLRKPRPDSANLGWRNASFRGYADHMQTEVFAGGLQQVLDVAAGRGDGPVEPTAPTGPTPAVPVLMCAEAVPWRCHRQLIADALLARGVVVEDIYSATLRKPHAMTPFARVEGATVRYPAPDPTVATAAADRGQLDLL